MHRSAESQPASGSPGEQAQITRIIDGLKDKPGAMLPILHGIQDHIGHIPDAAVPLIADALRQTRAEVHGVISFYHHFRTRPAGAHVVYICRAEACQALGARQLETHVRKTLGVEFHQTTPDGEFTLEPVYCLGNCACGPSLRVNDDIYGRVTTARFDGLMDELTTQPLELRS